MTIPQHLDLSDVYTPTLVKPLIEKVFAELHGNSVFTRMIDEMMPQGIDPKRWGRISKSAYHSNNWSKVKNSADGIHRMGRLLDTDDNITVRINLHRVTTYQSGYTFGNQFHMDIQFIDNQLVQQRHIKSDLHTLSYRGKTLDYDPKTDFEPFVLLTLANDFNNNAQNIMDSFESRKVQVRAIHAATARY
jgi:cyclophilin family peptidyl-prolyl cis-trans isomerase